jgi:hypothetical protein
VARDGRGIARYYSTSPYYGYYGLGFGAFGLGYFYYDPFWWDPYSGGYGYGGYGYGGYGYGGYGYGGYGNGGYPAYGYGDQQQYDLGSLRLQVKPREAEVYVDGYYVGQVGEFDGGFHKLDLEAGPHKIEVRAAGFEPLTFDVKTVPGQTINYKGDLRPLGRDR